MGITDGKCSSVNTDEKPTKLWRKSLNIDLHSENINKNIKEIDNRLLKNDIDNETIKDSIVSSIMNKSEEVTNISVSTSGVVSWDNASHADGYLISTDGINYTPVFPGQGTTSYNY